MGIMSLDSQPESGQLVASGVTVELSGRWKAIQSLTYIHDLRKTLTHRDSVHGRIHFGCPPPPDARLFHILKQKLLLIKGTNSLAINHSKVEV
jgi:hypothetical protein